MDSDPYLYAHKHDDPYIHRYGHPYDHPDRDLHPNRHPIGYADAYLHHYTDTDDFGDCDTFTDHYRDLNDFTHADGFTHVHSFADGDFDRDGQPVQRGFECCEIEPQDFCARRYG